MNHLFVLFKFLLIISIVIAKESPGFFIKVSKNIPRLGRRTDVIGREPFSSKNAIDQDPLLYDYSASAPKDESESGPQNGFSKLQQRKPGDVKLYNNVQPYDSAYLLLMNAGGQHPAATGKDDLKFISWMDFDKALDSDRMLFEKLISLHRREYNGVGNISKNPDFLNKLAMFQLMSALDNNAI